MILLYYYYYYIRNNFNLIVIPLSGGMNDDYHKLKICNPT